MGKLKGLIQFTGHIDGLSFYEMNGKIIVRKTGGFDGKKIKNDANYLRVRENSSEFAHCAKMGTYFRSSLQPYLKRMCIPYVHNRVLGLFQEISKLDLVSLRGERKVFIGLQSEDAKSIIARFEFDKNRSFDVIFPFRCNVDFDEGRLFIRDFSSRQLKKVGGATHVHLRFMFIGLDFEQQSVHAQNSSDVLTISLQEPGEMDLEFTCAIPDRPVVFGLMYLEYIQRVNEEDYDLKTGGLKIIGFRE